MILIIQPVSTKFCDILKKSESPDIASTFTFPKGIGESTVLLIVVATQVVSTNGG